MYTLIALHWPYSSHVDNGRKYSTIFQLYYLRNTTLAWRERILQGAGYDIISLFVTYWSETGNDERNFVKKKIYFLNFSWYVFFQREREDELEKPS